MSNPREAKMDAELAAFTSALFKNAARSGDQTGLKSRAELAELCYRAGDELVAGTDKAPALNELVAEIGAWVSAFTAMEPKGDTKYAAGA